MPASGLSAQAAPRISCAISNRLTRDTASNARSSFDTVASCRAAGSAVATFAIGASAMRQIGQSPGDDDVTSGGMGQTKDGRAAAAAAGASLPLRATRPTTRAPAAIATRISLVATIAALERDWSKGCLLTARAL